MAHDGTGRIAETLRHAWAGQRRVETILPFSRRSPVRIGGVARRGGRTGERCCRLDLDRDTGRKWN